MKPIDYVDVNYYYFFMLEFNALGRIFTTPGFFFRR